MQRRFHRADRRFDAMDTGLDVPKVGQRRHQADGPVAAHAEVTGVVEKDHSGTGARVLRFAEQSPHQHVAATGFEHGSGAPGIESLGENASAFSHAALAKVRKTVDHQAGRFAAGVRIDNADALHGCLPLLWIFPGKGGAAGALAA